MIAVLAILLALAPLQDPAPPSVADLLKQLDDKNDAARKAAFDQLRASADGAARLRSTLETLRNAWFKRAIEERADAIRTYADARKKRFTPRQIEQRQQVALGFFESGDFKSLEPVVKKLWEDFYPDPAKAADDAAVERAAKRVVELVGFLKEIGAPAKEDLVARMKEAFRAMDEECPLGAMAPKDQSVMRENAALRDQVSVEEYRLVQVTNLYRVLLGKPAYKLNLKLCAAAREHSKDMVEKGFFSHESPLPGKKSPQDRAARHGTSGGAENIFAGSEKGESAFWTWFGSAGHHRNMLGGAAEIGVGNHDRHWTEMFGG